MYFYKVWVRSAKFHGNEPLTYYSRHKCQAGTIVTVPLQNNEVLGIVVSDTPKPNFITKQLTDLKVSPLPRDLLSLGHWLTDYYPAPLGLIAQLLLPPAISERQVRAIQIPIVNPPNTSSLPALTSEQEKVVAKITQPDTYLLHGRTGSGKTRVYIELALKVLKLNRSAIILTPEIGLTSQLAANFREVFDSQVVIIHSSLSPAERQQVWLRILNAAVPLVVIGPRSALFSPLANVGLIVVDEAHETAYKQEQAPHYHASRVAGRLAGLHKACLILGSATPSVADYFLAERKQKPILLLEQLPAGDEQPVKVKIVDIKNRRLFTRGAHLSSPLIHAIEKALNNNEQALLYLNRRGTARVVLCENCGWQALCPHCNLPLTYHGDIHSLRCHICGYKNRFTPACPTCGQPAVLFKSIGTKALVDEVRRQFPKARLQRFDTDNAKGDRLEEHYDKIRSGQVDILIGTQLIAKGLDLPNLGVVGVVSADTSLYLPDFSAHERTYQLIRQVLGRVGRGHRDGTAIIQTYHPDYPVIQAAIKGDWQAFYHTELTDRQRFFFPPFCHLLKLTCRRSSVASAESAANKLKKAIEQLDLRVKIDGPAPSFHEQFQAKFQWQLVVKATKRSDLLSVIKLIPSNGWSYDIDPMDLL